MNVTVKKLIKENILYQVAKKEQYLPISNNRYLSMPDIERTDIRYIFYWGNKCSQYLKMLNEIQISIQSESRFQTWIDTGLILAHAGGMIDNISPDYSCVINHSINELLKQNEEGNTVARNNTTILNGVIKYIGRIIDTLDEIIKVNPGKNNLIQTRLYFARMIDDRAKSLEEALQRILLWSSIFWQSNHRLMGLGRLDYILDQFSQDSDSETRISILQDFYDAIHKYYSYKSSDVSKGDTGQIILLGGLNSKGEFFVNSLTYEFIIALRNHPLPDPKLLLRVSHEMPDSLLVIALETIAKGIGCPLLSNDDVIIPALEAFGYNHEDACNYVTSACWEPVAYGKSLEQNNMGNINFAEAIVATYNDPRFVECTEFQDVLEIYYEKLDSLASNMISNMNELFWESDPIMTLFTQGCIDCGKDIAQGGAIYNNYGFLTVGLANSVNSLINLDKLVFKEKKYSLFDMKSAATSNYMESEALRKELYENDFFGQNDEYVIGLAKTISERISSRMKTYRNCFGGSVKYGLSSPNYLSRGKITKATLDGRVDEEPLSVHISAKKIDAYTELISFAAALNYSGNRSNGNVVDFFVSPNLINESFDKFVRFIKTSIKLGFFQMQMNVVDSKTLIDAKKNPEKYPNLIVRVWGFSAYFVDLPVDYQDLMIKRAKQNEGKV